MDAMKPTYNIGIRHRWTDNTIVNVPKEFPRTSWWQDAPRDGFAKRAEAELPAMEKGRFGRSQTHDRGLREDV